MKPNPAVKQGVKTAFVKFDGRLFLLQEVKNGHGLLFPALGGLVGHRDQS